MACVPAPLRWLVTPPRYIEKDKKEIIKKIQSVSEVNSMTTEFSDGNLILF